MLRVTRKGKGHLTAHGRSVAVVAARGAARGVVAARRALLGCSLASCLTCHFILLREIII